jgi:hypothetical protein
MSGPDARTPPTAGGSKYDELVELLDEAILMAPEARADFLDGLALRDPVRARELRELLDALPNPERTSDASSPGARAGDGASADPNHADPNQADSHPSDPFVGEPPLGELLGGCRLTEVLGRGGIGTVFAANQIEPPRPVAVKVLRAASARASHLRRFQTEAAALARLEHPAIVRIYSSGIARREGLELPYIVMERVDGATNVVEWARVQRDRRAVAAIFADICDGMQHGHGRGLIHRDLKPSNILMTRDGRPRIIDFGVARIFGDGAARADETLVGAVIGTPAYMAPEQFDLPSSEIDTRVDVHAIGTMLYEALSGRRAYDIPRHQYYDAARIIRSTEPVALDRIDRTVPRDLSAIVARAMAKDREKRYASMSELAEDLRAFIDGRAVRARPESRPERAVRWVRRNPAWATAVTVTSVALVAATVVSTISWRKASHQLLLASLARAATASSQLDLRETLLRMEDVRSIVGEGAPPFLAGFIEAPFDGAVFEHQRPPEGHLMAGAISPDGSRWIASGDGPHVYLVDLADNRVVGARVPSQPQFTWAAGFNASGTRAYVGCDKGLYEVFADGRCETLAEGELGQVRGFVPTSTADDGFYLFPGSTVVARYLPGRPFEPVQAQFRPGTGIGNIVRAGARMYAASAASQFHAVDVAADGSLAIDEAWQPPPGSGIAVAVRRDGSLVARGLHQGFVELLDPETGALRASTFVRHEVRSVGFSPSGDFIFVGDRGGRIHRFRIEDSTAVGGEVRLLEDGIERTRNQEPVWALGAIDDTQVVANIGYRIARLDFGSAWSRTPSPHPDGMVSAVSTFDGRRLRAIGRSGVVHELDMATGGWSPVANGALGFGGPARTSIAPDGRTMAGWDGSVVRLRRLDDGQAVEHEVRSGLDAALFAWSPDASRVACILSERVIVLDAERGRVAEGSIPSGFLRCAHWIGPNDIAVGSTRGQHRVNLLRVEGDRVELVEEGPIKLHFDWIGDRLVEFSPGGPVNVYPVGGFERLRGEIERSLVGHTDAASSCAISPDGAWIATGGADTMIRIWNLANGDCYLPLPGAEATVHRLRWSPDGGALIAIDQRGHVRYFDSVPRRERVTSGRG